MSKNHIFLMGALAFTLSALPGISRSAEVQSLSLSSQAGEACDLREQLGDGESAKCDIAEVVVEGRKIRGSINARKATRTPKKKWGDDDTAVVKGPEEVVEVDVQLETDCSVCAGGVRQNRPSTIVVTKEQAKDIETIVRKQFDKDAKALAADAKADAKRQQDIDQCLITEDGTKIEDASDRMSCRVDKFSAMTDDKQKEKYFDKYLKGDLQTMLASNSQAQRNQAASILKGLYDQRGQSEFLKESMDDMAKFGAAHNLGATILQMDMNDPRRIPLLGQWDRANKYFAARGMQINSSLGDALAPDLMTSYQQDLAKYSQELTQIAQEAPNKFTTNRPTFNGGNTTVNPTGTGRTGMFNGGGGPGSMPSAPAVTPALGGGSVPNAPRPGVTAPIGGGRASNGIPNIGGFLGR